MRKTRKVSIHRNASKQFLLSKHLLNVSCLFAVFSKRPLRIRNTSREYISSRLRQITQTSVLIRHGNRTEWSSILSVKIRIITKSDNRAAGVRFVYREYDYRPNSVGDTKSYYLIIIKITISEKRGIANL